MAILLWSIAMFRKRTLPIGLAIYGTISAIAIIVGIVSGRLDSELHGFRIFTLIQAIWFVLAGIFLWRCSDVDLSTQSVAQA